MCESGLQMSVAKRLHFHFEATSVKGIYLLRKDPVAGELPRARLLPRVPQEARWAPPCVAGPGSTSESPGRR